MEKIKLPFTTELKGGNKDSFKILNEKQLINKFKKNGGIFNIIREIINSSRSNNENRINYVKASESNKNRKSKK